MTARITVLLLALICTGWPLGAQGHSRSESYSHWHQSGNRINATITMPAREVTRLPEFIAGQSSPGPVLAAHLQDQTSVDSDAGRCDSDTAQVVQAAPGFVRIELRFDCGDHVPTGIFYRGLFDVAPSHVHYAKFYAQGHLRGEFLLTDARDSRDLLAFAQSDSSHSFADFLQLGIQHIAGGADHVAFLLGMLLVAGSTARSVIAVTGFTLGHSVSLAAAVLGYVHADAGLVEAFIGFTVALVAVEYFVLRRRQVDLLALSAICAAWLAGTAALVSGLISARAVIAYLGIGVFAFCYLLAAPRMRESGNGNALFVATSCFGLIHGFGFAGFLMETGIAGSSLVKPLLGFNVGVEIGQLLLVGMALLIGRFFSAVLREPAPQILAAGLCGVGVFWFVGRSLGL